jgi:ATP-binding cassette subfamily B protein
LLKNPPILIFDEATSALDSKTEIAIQAELEEAAIGRTTLVIASPPL